MTPYPLISNPHVSMTLHPAEESRLKDYDLIQQTGVTSLQF
jgi:hypothetical protein